MSLIPPISTGTRRAVPDIHSLMIFCSLAICLVAMALYAFVPADRKDLFEDTSKMAMVFLFGKFTNNFARAPKPSRDDKQ